MQTLFFFFKVFWRTDVLFWGHWYPCFGFLVTSPLGFKARVGSALFTIFAKANEMYIPQDSPLVLHLPTSWRPARSRSLPHMHRMQTLYTLEYTEKTQTFSLDVSRPLVIELCIWTCLFIMDLCAGRKSAIRMLMSPAPSFRSAV